ncbi:hypothetical protein TSO221_24510 [Azospirillum sp. TSO22-1]|nr:hypothetical protein TSO221_24510 [Azospirillum sp. TSO22-1]
MDPSGILEDQRRREVKSLIQQRLKGQVAAVGEAYLDYVVTAVMRLQSSEEILDAANHLMLQAQIGMQEPTTVLTPDEVEKNSKLIRGIKDRLIEKKQHRDRLLETRDAIESSDVLIRKLSFDEASTFMNPAKLANQSDAFPSGVEGAKAFAISRIYKFSNAARNEMEGAYDFLVHIRLTRTLKDYFLKHLWVNEDNLKVGNEKFSFRFNPQVKYEKGGYTILIPRQAWPAFVSRVEVYSVYGSDGKMIFSPRDLANWQHNARQERMQAGYNMEPTPGGKPLHDYSSSYIS